MYLNPDRIIQNKGCYSFGGNQNVHHVPENANICSWVDVKGLFDAPDNHIFHRFSVSRGWTALQMSGEGKKVNQLLSLSPQLTCVYLSRSCDATLPIQMYFAWFVCQLWTHSLIPPVTRWKSRISGRDGATRSLKSWFSAAANGITCFGFYDDAIKRWRYFTAHVSEATSLHASSKGALMFCLHKGLLARNKSGRHK